MTLGLGGVLIVFLSLATGTDFLSLLRGSGPATSAPAGAAPVNLEEERLVNFVGAVFEDLQHVWSRLLGPKYARTSLVLFRDEVASACGGVTSWSGPFYCQRDQRVYLDLGFFTELDRKFGAPGDFAQAYVVAHELGHHAQHLLGTTERVQRDRRNKPDGASVALELQADCYAGVWGNLAPRAGGSVELEPDDAEEGLRAAASVSDDWLKRMGSGRVIPDPFTYGSSAQRADWFQRGFRSGDLERCVLSLDAVDVVGSSRWAPELQMLVASPANPISSITFAVR